MKNFLIIILPLFLIAQTEQDWLRADPEIDILSKDLNIDVFRVEEKTTSNIPFFFFEPESHELKDSYSSTIQDITRALDRNPDVHLLVKGYYSRDIDDILSPALLMELAEKRAEAIRQEILMNNPSLVGRIDHPEGYDMSMPLLSDTSMMDLRATLQFHTPGFSTRSVLIQDFAPYIRTSYRDIIKIILPELDSLMSRNPDIFIQIYARGKPWDVPLWECYNRLERVGDFLTKKLPEDAKDRITFYVDNGKPTKSIDIRLCFAPIGATVDKWKRAPASQVFQDFRTLDFQINWNRQMQVARYDFSIISEISGQRRFHTKRIAPKTDSSFTSMNIPDTLSLPSDILKDLLLPGKNHAKLRTLATNGHIETVSKSFDIDVDSLEMTITHEAVYFMPNSDIPLVPKNVNLFRIAEHITDLSEIWRYPLNVTLQSVSDPSGSALARVEEQLHSMLIFNLELKDEEELEKWMKKEKVSISSTLDTTRISLFPFVEIHLEVKGDK